MDLSCPRCASERLTPRDVIPAGGGAPAEVHRCDRCKGVWLDEATLASICPTVSHLSAHRDEVVLTGAPGAGIAACPRCRLTPYQVEVLGVTIDFCVHCNGVWLDGDEYEESMLDGGEARPAKRQSAYRQAGNRVGRGEVKCVDCGAVVPIDRTFMRENGHTCSACNSRREIGAADARVAEGGNVMWAAGETHVARPPQTPLESLVESLSDFMGWTRR
jgi:Zn-finger nucleic acid-binding protein